MSQASLSSLSSFSLSKNEKHFNSNKQSISIIFIFSIVKIFALFKISIAHAFLDSLSVNKSKKTYIKS